MKEPSGCALLVLVVMLVVENGCQAPQIENLKQDVNQLKENTRVR